MNPFDTIPNFGDRLSLLDLNFLQIAKPPTNRYHKNSNGLSLLL